MRPGPLSCGARVARVGACLLRNGPTVGGLLERLDHLGRLAAGGEGDGEDDEDGGDHEVDVGAALGIAEVVLDGGGPLHLPHTRGQEVVELVH